MALNPPSFLVHEIVKETSNVKKKYVYKKIMVETTTVLYQYHISQVAHKPKVKVA